MVDKLTYTPKRGFPVFLTLLFHEFKIFALLLTLHISLDIVKEYHNYVFQMMNNSKRIKQWYIRRALS